MRIRKPYGPLYAGRETGATGIMLSLAVAGTMLVVVAGMQADTDNTVEFDYRVRANAEMRRANQAALESVSQMLVAGTLSVPLPGGRSYNSNMTTAQREAQDSRNLLTGFSLTDLYKGKNLALDKGGMKIRFASCNGRLLDENELERYYGNMSEWECDRILNTDVELKEVTISEHLKGFFTMNQTAAKVAMAAGQVAKKSGDGWEIYGAVRRNLMVEAVTTYDRANKFTFGTAGGKDDARALKENVVMSHLTDVRAHTCRWNNPEWQEKITFVPPPISMAHAGQPLTAYISQTRGDPGRGDGTCAYQPAGHMTGWKGGMHVKAGVTDGWGANVCGYGTMFYIERRDSPNCFVNLVPLRWQGNFVGGCFGPGTKITMADGSEKNVEDVIAGDMVLNPMSKKGQRVASTRKGYESKPLLEVGYAGKKIPVTHNHPFVVKGERGAQDLKQARYLKQGDQVLGADGQFHVVEVLRTLPEEPYQWVHNLALEADTGAIDQHVILANGIMTGDHFLQNQLEAQQFAETGRKVKSGEAKLPFLSAVTPNLAE